ncbi:MAG TPA: metallophosphoesterase [Erysipelotrichaceae bacterium]|nr:metallophosphoesterase [Erysipelotrichaceae bacterium]HQA84440.1 metallophosphoesterase [Erysipelotrichaceae bacterium]
MTLIIVLIIAFLVYAIYQNKNVGITFYEFFSDKVEKEKRIVHLSDIHNDLFGKNNIRLIELIKSVNPDYIFLTGDLLDSRRTNVYRCYYLIEKIIKIAPIYFVTGNHESRKTFYPKFKEKLIELGVIVLDNRKIKLEEINLVGIDDPGFKAKPNETVYRKIIDEQLKEIELEDFNVLLAHRPQYFDIYAKYDFDFVFTGHAHGGQIRLPYIGGLLSPQQGILPKYTIGIYESNNTKMVVSRGLGNSQFPLRVFNNPEIVVVDIKKAG